MPRAMPVGALVVYLGDEPPGTSDDSATIRARRGYWWVDRSKPALWVCVDPAEDAAVWHRLGNAEDLAAIALSGSWDDLGDTPTTLAGYGITDAATSAQGALADTALQPGDVGTAAYQDVAAFDAAGSAAAVAGDLASHENDTNNPHAVTYAQVGADPSGSAAAAESNANSYTDSAISALGSAAHEHVGTQPLELPRNTELASGAFAPYEPVSLYPITPVAAHTLTPDDSGKIVWSAAHGVTLPDTSAPGMQPGWRVWVKNTDGASSITIDCDGASDTIDGNASLSLAAGESVLIVMIATGQFGSL